MLGARSGQFSTINKHLLHTVCLQGKDGLFLSAISSLQWLPTVGAQPAFTPTCFHVHGRRPHAFSSVLPLTSLPGAKRPQCLLSFFGAATLRLDLLCPLPSPPPGAVRPSWSPVMEDCHASISLTGLLVSRLFLFSPAHTHNLTRRVLLKWTLIRPFSGLWLFTV